MYSYNYPNNYSLIRIVITIYIDDICTLVTEAISNKINATLNVATGMSCSIRDIARIIITLMNCGGAIEFSKQDSSDKRRAGHMYFNPSLLQKNLPHMVFTDLKKGIERTINAYGNP